MKQVARCLLAVFFIAGATAFAQGDGREAFRDGRRNGGRDGHSSQPHTIQLACVSTNFQSVNCNPEFDSIQNITVLQQYSSHSCLPGQDYGVVPGTGTFWVSNGCSALFSVTGYYF